MFANGRAVQVAEKMLARLPQDETAGVAVVASGIEVSVVASKRSRSVAVLSALGVKSDGIPVVVRQVRHSTATLRRVTHQ